MNDNDLKILKVDYECPSCKKAKQTISKIPVRRIIEKLDACFTTNDLRSAENLLEYWQKEAVNIGDLSGELSVVNEMLGLYRKTSNEQKAEKAVSRSLELIEILNVGGVVSGATIMLNAATTCKAFGRPEKALPIYEKVGEIYSKNLKTDDLLFAAFYNNFATTLVDLERFKDAEKLYFDAVKITNKQLNSLLDCAVTYVNLAHLYEAWEGALCEKIGECLEKAETILENANIPRDSYYAFVASKCAPSFDYFGFFAFANELQKRSREIYERD